MWACVHVCVCVCVGGRGWSGLGTLQILQPSVTLHPHYGEQGPCSVGQGSPGEGEAGKLGSPCPPLPCTALAGKGQAWLTHASSLGPSRSCSPGTHGQETRENRETPRCSLTQAEGPHCQAPCATESRTTLGGRCHRLRSEPRLWHEGATCPGKGPPPLVAAAPRVQWFRPPGVQSHRTCVKHRHAPGTQRTLGDYLLTFIIHIIICSPSVPPSSLPTSPLLLSPIPSPQTLKPVFRGPARCRAAARLGAMMGWPRCCWGMVQLHWAISPCATLDPGQDTSAFLFPSWSSHQTGEARQVHK